MDELNSTVFRTTYPRLTRPTAVVVLGRIIGHWYPAGSQETPKRQVESMTDVMAQLPGRKIGGAVPKK